MIFLIRLKNAGLAAPKVYVERPLATLFGPRRESIQGGVDQALCVTSSTISWPLVLSMGANLASLRAPDRRPRALKSRRRSKKSSSSHVTMLLSPAAPQAQEVLAPWPGPRHLRSDNRSSAPGAGWRPDVGLEVWPDVAIAPTGSGRCASAGRRHSVRRPPGRRESSAAADWPVCAAGPSRLWRAFYAPFRSAFKW